MLSTFAWYRGLKGWRCSGEETVSSWGAKGFTGRMRCSSNVTQTCKDLEQKSGWEEVLMQTPGQKQAMLNKRLCLSRAPARAPEQLDLLVWCTRKSNVFFSWISNCGTCPWEWRPKELVLSSLLKLSFQNPTARWGSGFPQAFCVQREHQSRQPHF